MKDGTRAALSDQTTWLRLPVMLLFFLLLQVATPLLIVVSVVGWLIRLFTGQQPEGVVDLGRTLGQWFDRCADYLCGGAQRRPFPFEDHDCPSDRPPETAPRQSGAKDRAPVASDVKTKASEASVTSTAAAKASAGQTSESGSAQAAAGGNARSKGSSEDSDAPKAEVGDEVGKKKTGKKKASKKKAGQKKTGQKKTGKKKASKKTGSQSKSNKKKSSKKTSTSKETSEQKSKKSDPIEAGSPAASGDDKGQAKDPAGGDQTPPSETNN